MSSSLKYWHLQWELSVADLSCALAGISYPEENKYVFHKWESIIATEVREERLKPSWGPDFSRFDEIDKLLEEAASNLENSPEGLKLTTSIILAAHASLSGYMPEGYNSKDYPELSISFCREDISEWAKRVGIKDNELCNPRTELKPICFWTVDDQEKTTESPAPKTDLLLTTIGLLLEVIKDGRSWNQSGLAAHFKESGIHGLGERSANGIFAGARKALKEARKK